MSDSQATLRFLNPTVNLGAYRMALAETGSIQILSALEPARVKRFAATARKDDIPWTLNTMDGDNVVRIPPAEHAKLSAAERYQLLVRSVQQAQENRFQYSFFGSMLTPSALQSQEPEGDLRALAAEIISEGFVEDMRALTGEPRIRGLNGQLTRYDPGQFLLPHDDSTDAESRLYAYVLNLSEDWWPDWGGLLQFPDDARNVVTTYTPHFNSLVVLRVPQMHCVSMVAPYAQRSRYAITGWFIA